jgi:energy-coupling factor transporter ATP-binding protein EcfA2
MNNIKGIVDSISRFKKDRYLLSLTEDDFRDQVVRPLFLRQNLKDGRDLCGPTEKGKDAVFISIDQLSLKNLYVVQTKKGKINMAKTATTNVVEIITQLRTALNTPVVFVMTKEKKYPAKVIVCASGKINDSAREYIIDTVKDSRIEFLDSDDLIPLLDEKLPEIWLGIDTDIFPYLHSVKKSLELNQEDLVIGDIQSSGSSLSTVTEKMFVSLNLFRTTLRPVRRKGKVTQEPHFEEIPVTGILSKKEHRYAILGEAGSGKSTSLRRLAYLLAEKGLASERPDFKIPIILKAAAVAEEKDNSLLNLCYEETQRLTHSKKPSFGPEDLAEGRVWLFIDALDEVPSEESQEKVLRSILEFVDTYPHCTVIVASRDYQSIKDLPELARFERYTLSPISLKQAELILKRIQKAKRLPLEITEETLRRLQDIHGMVINPLLVTVFAAITEYSRKDIPANITELFKKYTELMLGRWDVSKGLAQQYHAPLKDFLLKKVAFEMHRRRITSIPLDEFSSLIQDELSKRGQKANIAQLLEETLYRSGLFRIISDSVEFRHLMLQEFFAGRGIPSKDTIEALILDEWWQRPIVFYFGENPGDNKSLDDVLLSLSSKRIEETYVAGLTLGLAIQACYLVETKNKVGVYIWVVEHIARAKDEFLYSVDAEGRYPISRFAFYYLVGRDSVACSVLEDNDREIVRALTSGKQSQDEKELKTFWIIVGLLECGLMLRAEQMIKAFRPKDARLLLAIHLGCFITAKLRVVSKEQRKIAERISESLGDSVRLYRTQILREFKSELLEVRKGQIKALEPPEPSDP